MKGNFDDVGDLTINFKLILEEFFDYIIWSSISVMLIEIPGNTMNKDVMKLKENIKNQFILSLIRNLPQSVFKNNVNELCTETPFINTLMGEFITETLSIFRIKLLNYFSSDELACMKVSISKIDDMKNTVQEYVIISFLDTIVISNVVRLILYSEKVSYAEVNEFRIHLIEIVKESLESSNLTLKEIKEFLESELDNLSLRKFIKDFISSSIMGYFTALMRTRDFDSMLERMKIMIKHKIPLNTDLTFIESSKIQGIVKWISDELIYPYFETINSPIIKIKPKIKDISKKIRNIFKNLLEKKIAVETAKDRLKYIENSIGISENELLLKGKINIDKKKYTKNRFITIERNSSKNEAIANNPKDMIGIMFNALISLIDVLEDELMTDFKLDHLYELIVEQSGKLNKLYL
jgi:hypothetical protein